MNPRKINLLTFIIFSQMFIFAGQDKKRKIEESAQENTLKKVCCFIDHIKIDGEEVNHEYKMLIPFNIFQREISDLPKNAQERAWEEYNLNLYRMTSDVALELARVYKNIYKYNFLQN